MGKPAKPNRVAGSSGAKAAFVKALYHVRSKKGIQHHQASGSKQRSAQRLSGSKARKSKKGTVDTRCSPGIISELFSELDSQRLDLLKEMGFQGLANMKVTKTNKHLGAYLLSKFDPISECLNAGTTSELKLTGPNVNLVLGIPCEGMDIVPATQQEVVTMKQYLCSVFDKESYDQITVSFLCRILYRSHDGLMTDKEREQFKTAFILFVVTKFLAPVALNNHISSRYIKTLVDIQNVQKYKWAKFVLDELKIAAHAL
jgi:hypothetical protein